MRHLFLLLLVFLATQANTQDKKINQKDNAGLKQGYWIVYGHMKPDKGYCDSCKVEEGKYLNDQYEGEWVKYHLDGKTPRLLVTYENGKPKGKYQKINNDGILLEEGVINGQRQLPTKGFYPCGKLHYTKSYSQNNTENGILKYYFNSCDCSDPSIELLQKTEKKINGMLVDTTYEFYKSGCQRAMIVYSRRGEILVRDYFRDTCTVDPDSPYQRCKETPKTTPVDCDPLADSTDFKGTVKVQNEEGNVEMQGVFKNGQLWKGKKFIYNKEGKLESIEIWKQGELKKRTEP